MHQLTFKIVIFSRVDFKAPVQFISFLNSFIYTLINREFWTCPFLTPFKSCVRYISADSMPLNAPVDNYWKNATKKKNSLPTQLVYIFSWRTLPILCKIRTREYINTFGAVNSSHVLFFSSLHGTETSECMYSVFI